MTDKPDGKPDWKLLWRGVKPQILMAAIIVFSFAVLIWLDMMGWLPTQSARE